MPSKDVMAVTHYLFQKNTERNHPLTNKKLQKLLYYSQAWSMVLNDGNILFQEDFEAWIHGPAIPSVYQQFKGFAFNGITLELDQKKIGFLNAKQKELIDTVWRAYGGFDADYLELLTHQEKPWQDARADTPAFSSSKAIIPKSSMREYYSQKLAEATKK